jgi:hypothetical protein
MSLKRKRPMARKSTTPGRRGEFEICWYLYRVDVSDWKGSLKGISTITWFK